MLIALTGAHSTGKTTLLESLRGALRDYTFLTEITRSVANEGHLINEKGDDRTQSLIMKAHARNLFYSNAIMDRCFLDGIVYTDYLHSIQQVSSNTLEQSLLAFERGIKHYDRLFYLEPEIGLVVDGVRSSSLQFREDVIKLFEFYIKEFNLPVIRITGSLRERKEQIIDNIGELNEV